MIMTNIPLRTIICQKHSVYSKCHCWASPVILYGFQSQLYSRVVMNHKEVAASCCYGSRKMGVLDISSFAL